MAQVYLTVTKYFRPTKTRTDIPSPIWPRHGDAEEDSSSRGAEILRERVRQQRPGAQEAQEAEEGRTRSIYTWLEGVNSVRWGRVTAGD